MLKMSKQALLPSLALLLSACAPTLTIKSDPAGANVFVLKNNGEKQSLGTTPIVMKVSELENMTPLSSMTGEMLPLTFEANGFKTTEVFVPPMRTGILEAGINVQLKPEAAETCSNTSADELLRYLHNAQKFANASVFQAAIDEVNKAIEKDPKFIRAYSMKGSIYFVQNRFDESQAMYEKALSIDPNFDEAIKMIAEIKKKKKMGSQ
jgi:tetratricopeptide (TPR) repeat protein